MLITYLRSSSYGTYDICEFQYFINYVLGFESFAGVSAQKGNVVHRSLELLAKKKLAEQQGEASFDDDLGTFQTKEVDSTLAYNLSFAHYLSKDNRLGSAEKAECYRWLLKVLDGPYSPLNKEIFKVEQFFDFEIQKEWACYNYTLNGEKLQGNLRLRGTIDLICKDNHDTLDVTDYKTGSRFNFANFKEKTFEYLVEDFQLRLYHYAIRRLFPEYKNVIINIYYINDGGFFTIPLDDSHIAETEEMISRRFNKIQFNQRPRLVKPSKKCNFCYYEKAKIGNLSICDSLNKEMIELGVGKLTDKYVTIDKLNRYSGAGRENVKI